MGRKLSINVSREQIKNLNKLLTEYDNSLQRKCERFVNQLVGLGISTAKARLATQKPDSDGVNYADYILFSRRTEVAQTGCKAVMEMTSTGIVESIWQTSDGVKTADVSPLLMVEFGSGLRAENPKEIPGVGQGTFPGQTHAFDKKGWFWQDIEGKWHHSLGVTPSAPMYGASIEMHEQIVRVAKEVFGGA